jgi:RNA polymerase sigma-70 factor (ECF subfamily)
MDHMEEGPVTSASLLVRLRDGHDADAWGEFVRLYAPVVYGFARKRGLQDADAADVMQDVLRSVSAAVGRLDYDTQRGSFRGWLYTVARNKIFNFLDRRRRQVVADGDSGTRQRLAEQAGPEIDLAGEWDLQYERRLAALAMETVKREFQPATWRAFLLTAVDGKSAKEAGEAVGLSPGAVYVAKSRVMARLREEVRRLQDEG